jgi:hypothetical protein
LALNQDVNIRLIRKIIITENTLAYFAEVSKDDEKGFKRLRHEYTLWTNKLECFSIEIIPILVVRPEHTGAGVNAIKLITSVIYECS